MHQLIISKSVNSFRERMELIYGLKCVNEFGYDPNVNTLFMGVYTPEDVKRINNHKGVAAVMWCGGDTSYSFSLNHIRIDAKHIAISHWVENRLKEYEIPYQFIPACFVDLAFWEPMPLGDKVYCYAPNNKYGLSRAREIEKEIPFEMIVETDHTKHDLLSLKQIYSQCFVGLRLRDWHDGNSATVQEMGLIGICTIWNGENPAAIKWENKEDIIKTIKLESLKAGTMQGELSKEVYDYFLKAKQDVLDLMDKEA